ncbi:MAG TPA: IclR family transcriptional regulator [Pseudolabrys sp.]|nr:IclR family transcriptional regulator [Pseudolabrys sp.]
MNAKILPGPAPRPADRQSIQSVDRALLLLETIAEVGGEATLTELSVRTGLNISTCHHLLATLIRRGFVAKVQGRRHYALGGRILSLGHACMQVDLPRRAEPFIDRLNRATGETVHLAVLQGDTIATLIKRDGRHAVRVDTGNVGQSDAVHATATGKAMLAWLPEDEIRRLAGEMRAFTQHTITDFAAFVEELRQVRRSGYAMDREEFQPGVVCVGAAVRDYAGAVVAAISASMPTMRANDEHIAMVRDAVIAAARELSAAFGETQTQTKPGAAESPATDAPDVAIA